MSASENKCLICNLTKSSFSSKTFEEKIQIKNASKPQPELPNLVQIKKKCTRRFNMSTYGKVNWLSGCNEKSSVFCWPCLLFSNERNVWTNDGYKDLENLSHATKRHESSLMHIRATLSFATFGQTHIDTMLDGQRTQDISQHNVNVKRNRNIMKRLIDATCFLSKQGLAFKGYSEGVHGSTNQGNYKELLRFLSLYDELLNSHLENSSVLSGLSNQIQTELIKAIGITIINKIKREIECTNFISIMVDETSDMSMKKQLSFVLRYVLEGNVYERFIAFKDVSSERTATALEQLVLETLEDFSCTNKLVAQTYDGAAVVASNLNELEANIRRRIPEAMFVHCYAHNLNLVLSQSVSKINKCESFFATLEELSSFFSKSSKRTDALDEIVKQQLQKVAPTTWTFHSQLVNVVKKHKDDLVTLFDIIQNNPDKWDRNSIFYADCFKRHIISFDFLFMLNIFDKIFSYTDVLYNVLQSKSYDIAYCIQTINDTIELINKMRSDFDIYVNETRKVKQSESPEPKRIRLSQNDELHLEPERVFLEIIDTVSMQLNVRFGNMQHLKFVELLNPVKYGKYNLKYPDDLQQNLSCIYNHYFDFVRLRNELLIVYSAEQFQGKYPREIMSFLKENKLGDGMPELQKLVELIITIPSTTASVERSFSALKRIKTYLRNTVREDRLSFLGLLSIEKELLMKVKSSPSFYDTVIDEFASNTRRIDLNYK